MHIVTKLTLLAHNDQTFFPSSAQQVSSPQSMGSCESLMLDLAGGGLVYHRRRSSSVGQSRGSAVDAISYADAADVEANAAAAQFLRVPPIVMACIR